MPRVGQEEVAVRQARRYQPLHLDPVIAGPLGVPIEFLSLPMTA
jgi:hypothetical protein